MTDPHDDERRLTERVDAYLRDEIGPVDIHSIARRATQPPARSVRRRWAMGGIAATVVLAAALTVSVTQLLPVSTSPSPSASAMPTPSVSTNPQAPAADQIGTFADGGLWARSGSNLYLSTDGGATWATGSIDPNPVAVFVLDAQHAWTVSIGPGSTGTTGDPVHDVVHYQVNSTSDGGASWQSTTLDGSYPETGAALSFVDANRGYLLIEPERFSTVAPTVFATIDGGRTIWQRMDTTGTNQLGYAHMFAVAPNDTLWAGAGATAAGAGEWTLLSVSRDAGVTWQAVNLPGRDVLAHGNYLLAPPGIFGSTVVVAVDANGPVTFYRSADEGRTWEVSQALTFDGPAYGRPEILDAKHWVVPAQTGLSLWITDDAGQTWREQRTRGLPGIGPILGVAFARDGEHGAALVSLGNSPAPNGLFVTTDGGQTWHAPVLPTGGPSPSPVGGIPWWMAPSGETTCLPAALFRVDGGNPVRLGNCTGALLIPPALATLGVGQELDLHMTTDGSTGPSYALPSSPDQSVVRLDSQEDTGATGRYLMLAPGHVVLTTNGACLDSQTGVLSQGSCPVLDVTVVADMSSPPNNASDFHWSAFAPEVFGGARPTALIQFGTGYLAVTAPSGTAAGTETWTHPTLWQSPQGLEWQALPDSPAFAGVPGSWVDVVNGLVRNGAGLIAVGMQQSFDASMANAEAWYSTDRTTWRRAVVDGAQGATMRLVYAVADGYAAIGDDGYSMHAGMAAGTAIWTSPDGRHWSRLPQSSVPGGVVIKGVQEGSGHYVAVGATTGTERPATSPSPIWVSGDGVHFTSMDYAALGADAGLAGVTWTGSAFVAVGSRSAGQAFALTSSNGLTWQMTALPAGDHAFVVGIVPTRIGLLVVGTNQSTGADYGEYWQFLNGIEWQAAPTVGSPDSGVSFNGVLQAGDLLWVTGQTDQGTERVWSIAAQGP